MDINLLWIIIGAVLLLVFLIKVFKFSIKTFFKLIINTILGGVLIFIINYFGENIGIHIGLNVITSIIVGILGVPGAILLLLIKII